MRLATWNINSVRARADRAVAFLEREDIDVVALQETKCKPEQFPMLPFEAAGYQVAAIGYNQWNGVAIVSRLPLSNIREQFVDQPRWETKSGLSVEARALGATIQPPSGKPFDLWSLYVPNGRELDDPHYFYKLQFLKILKEDVSAQLAADPEAQLMLVGDWNIAPQDSDVWDREFFEGKTHVSEPEREAFKAFEEAGLQEVTRGRADNYTYWDYQQLRFPRNQGMRIDFALASPALAARVTGAKIDRDERKGKGASDHVPVIVEID